MKLIDISTPKHPNTFSKVDDADFDWLNQWKWTAIQEGKRIYAHRYFKNDKKNYRWVRMHKMIMGTPTGFHTDHINGDGLDNRRENLRVCTPSENYHNNFGHKDREGKSIGVVYDKRHNRFYARINNKYKCIYIGCFKSEQEASDAYKAKSIELFGKFSPFFING